MSEGAEKRRRGRPPKGEDAKRHAIAVRTTRELKEQIEAEASRNGRSIAQEIEGRLLQTLKGGSSAFSPDLRDKLAAAALKKGVATEEEVTRRLERSFIEEELTGGEQTRDALRMIAGGLTFAERRSGHRWHEDYHTWAAAYYVVNQIMWDHRPKPSLADLPAPPSEEAQRALAATEEARERFNDWLAEHPAFIQYRRALLSGDAANPATIGMTEAEAAEGKRLWLAMLESDESFQPFADEIEADTDRGDSDILMDWADDPLAKALIPMRRSLGEEA